MPDLKEVIAEQEGIFEQEFDYQLEASNLRRMCGNVQVSREGGWGNPTSVALAALVES